MKNKRKLKNNMFGKEKIIGSKDSWIDAKLAFSKPISDKVIKLLIEENVQLEDVDPILSMVKQTVDAEKAKKYNVVYLKHLINGDEFAK